MPFLFLRLQIFRLHNAGIMSSITSTSLSLLRHQPFSIFRYTWRHSQHVLQPRSSIPIISLYVTRRLGMRLFLFHVHNDHTVQCRPLVTNVDCGITRKQVDPQRQLTLIETSVWKSQKCL